MKWILVWLVSVFMVLLTLSCQDNPNCNQELPYDAINVAFFDADSLTEEFIVFSLVRALGNDSTFYDDEDSLSVFEMKLNPSMDTLSYIYLMGVREDTLVIKYNRKLEWLSEECGPSFAYDGLEIISHTFDSISLAEPVIDVTVDENIEIYY